MTANNMSFGLNSDVNRTKREVKKPNPTKVPDTPKPKPSKVSEKQPLKVSKSIFQKDDPVEVNNGVNPVILFFPAIGFGMLISHAF